MPRKFYHRLVKDPDLPKPDRSDPDGLQRRTAESHETALDEEIRLKQQPPYPWSPPDVSAEAARTYLLRAPLGNLVTKDEEKRSGG